MLMLILIDVQYLQNTNFSFEKGLNGQISVFLPQVPPPNKKSPHQNFSFPRTVGRDIPRHPLMLFGKFCINYI